MRLRSDNNRTAYARNGESSMASPPSESAPLFCPQRRLGELYLALLCNTVKAHAPFASHNRQLVRPQSVEANDPRSCFATVVLKVCLRWCRRVARRDSLADVSMKHEQSEGTPISHLKSIDTA